MKAVSIASKFFTYRNRQVGLPQLGLWLEGSHYDLTSYAQSSGVELPFDSSSMFELISSGANGLRYLNQLLSKPAVVCPVLETSSIEFLSPFRPRNAIYAVGWNFVDHFAEGRNAGRPNTPKSYPEYPVFFCKTANTVNGPYSEIPSHSQHTLELDWEVELAVIIGRPGRDIPVEDSLKHVFGYTIVNDVTARDIQQKRHGGQWVKGKSLDGTAPMGPYVVLESDFQIRDQALSCSVNGELVQSARLSDMYFSVPQILSELSRGLTLQRGDLVITGTPSGVGHYRNPPKYLKSGDLLESYIEGIGTLRNRVGS
jgi:2-keto-4-pentenoate hydratase/2-oxohepta-3-ene-1,7-dioic acid hydratase in catechol pathway